MSNKFKQQSAAQRAGVPQIDLEASPSPVAEPIAHTQPPQVSEPPIDRASQASEGGVKLTPVNTDEPPVNRGFFMYPSRHRQVAKDLAYIQDRSPG